MKFPWARDSSIATHIPTQDNTTQKRGHMNAEITFLATVQRTRLSPNGRFNWQK
jgi:hypothetical protein